MRGDGRVFKRSGSSILWISFYRNGGEVRESTKTDDPKKAEKILRSRMRVVQNEQRGLEPFIGSSQNRLRVSDLLDDLESDLKIRGIGGIKALSHFKPTRAAFGDFKATSLSSDAIDKVVKTWLEEKRSPGTIDRELSVLTQAYNLAIENGKLSTAPKIRKLKVPNVREGFFEKKDLEALLLHLTPVLKDFTLFAYTCGWRKGEIASLRWEDVDLDGRVIRLRGEHSKNGRARLMSLEGPLMEIIERQLADKEILTDQGVFSSPFVFHRNGKPIAELRRIWATACRKAKIGSKLFHDLRRTAIRNMTRGGIQESIAMRISGHRTRSVFDRYNVIDESDMRDAALKIAKYNEEQNGKL